MFALLHAGDNITDRLVVMDSYSTEDAGRSGMGLHPLQYDRTTFSFFFFSLQCQQQDVPHPQQRCTWVGAKVLTGWAQRELPSKLPTDAPLCSLIHFLAHLQKPEDSCKAEVGKEDKMNKESGQI